MKNKVMDTTIKELWKYFPTEVMQMFGYSHPDSWKDTTVLPEDVAKRKVLRDLMGMASGILHDVPFPEVLWNLLTGVALDDMDSAHEKVYQPSDVRLHMAQNRIQLQGDPYERFYAYATFRSGMIYNWSSWLNDLRMECLHCLLARRIVGNPALKQAVMASIRMFLTYPIHTKPLSLMFAGTTGSGKTATAEIIAQALFPDMGKVEAGKILDRTEITRFYRNVIDSHVEVTTNAFHILDMGNFTGESSITALLGKQTGKPDDPVDGVLPLFCSTHRMGVIVFDEVEKADVGIRQSLLGMMDQGRLRSGRGTEYDVSNFVFILTTNAGVSVISDRGICSHRPGFEGDATDQPDVMRMEDLSMQPETPPIQPTGCTESALPPDPVVPLQQYGKHVHEMVMRGIREVFAPEFLARLQLFFFWPCYTMEEAKRLVYMEISTMEKRLAKAGVTIRWLSSERARFADTITVDFQKRVLQQGVRGLKEYLSLVEGKILDYASELPPSASHDVVVDLCGFYRGINGRTTGGMKDSDVICMREFIPPNAVFTHISESPIGTEIELMNELAREMQQTLEPPPPPPSRVTQVPDKPMEETDDTTASANSPPSDPTPRTIWSKFWPF